MDGRLTTGSARWARGGAVGVLTVGLGSTAHVVGGGHALAPVALLALTLLVSGLAVALSGRRWTVRPLLATFLLAQSGVHAVAMAESGHVMGSQAVMVAAHGAAATLLVAAVLLGERALLGLFDLLVLRAQGLRPASVPTRAAPVALHRPTLRAASAHLAALRGRAPPAVA